MYKNFFRFVGFMLCTSLFFVSNLFIVKAGEKQTLKNLLKIAVEPVGKVLYIYGGGWDEKDNGAGRPAKTIGLYPLWEKFYDSQNHNYDFEVYDYKKSEVVIYWGLDCTGYMGWLLYNYLEDKSETDDNKKEGYVFKSSEMANKLAELGFGNVIDCKKVYEDQDFRPGDIMVSKTKYHVYMVLGKCSDGSVLFVHSSPPGLSICGTVDKNNNLSSEAIKLAEKYMTQYYPDYQKKFPKRSKPSFYLTEFDRFRFNDKFISDPDGYYNKSSEEILSDLFVEAK